MKMNAPGWMVASVGLGLAAGQGGWQDAAGQEYCVACASPPAVYRCVIGNVAPGTGGGSLSQLCVATMMRQGGHGSCAVQGGTVFDCAGPIRRIGGEPSATPQPGASVAAMPQRGLASPPAQPASGAKPAPVAAAAAPAPKDAPPQTVEELARRMAAPQGNGLDAAGKAIGDAAQKTWGCVASFFKSC